MKKKNIFRICALAMASTMALTSCSDVLDEQKRDGFDLTFFQTTEGVEGGLTSLYSHLRNIYGSGYYYATIESGTDEYTYGHEENSNALTMDLSGRDELNPSNMNGDLWGNAFSEINTASAVIENATLVGIDPSLVAEAYFFRAFYYFQLVQTFGGVPLDLGGGMLHSNTAPKRTSTRNTVEEVYNLCILPDLEKAVEDLPAESRLSGTVNKTTARLYLAKAYLTYAWWLKNPNNIATYPECTRDASKAAGYFQKAYDTAMAAINNPGSNGLEDYYYLVNIAQNDRNKEWLLWADHTQESEQYNGASLGWGNGASPENFVCYFVTWNYCGWMGGANCNLGTQIIPVQREASQPLGRPWTRMATTKEGLAKFTNTENDSRWDGTFTTQYRVNFQKTKAEFEWVEGPNGDHLKAYDTFLKFIPADADDSKISYDVNNAQIGLGKSADEKSWVVSVNCTGRSRYPTLWKVGPYRTDYDFEKEISQQNAASTRPYVIAKFSELYLVAAEAAVMGATGAKSARDLVNVLRARAGKWNYVVNEASPSELAKMDAAKLASLAEIKDCSAAMTSATPADITIDYILDERLREFFGEGYRWFDLVRTQKWEELAGTYTIAPRQSVTPEKFNRKIEKFHYLRPIPQDQIDAMEGTNEDKKAFQNPGY